MSLSLKQALSEYLERRGLDARQLARLRSMQESRRPAVRWGAWRWAGVAAVVVVAFSLGLLLPWTDTPQDMSLQIAEEVVGNHLKRKPLEVQGRELGGLRSYFRELDFVLRDSRELAVAGLDLQGGRYCSLQGIDAAQLSLRDEQGSLHTLYQVPYERGVFSDLPRIEAGEEPQQVYARGVGVRIWVEKGILFALTED